MADFLTLRFVVLSFGFVQIWINSQSPNGDNSQTRKDKIMGNSTPPKMGNNGGTTLVRINGKRIYLGKYGNLEASQNYARYIAE
jgi:hypothetical protein